MHAKIALVTYTVREEWAADPIGTLERIKGLGYEGIEFGLDLDDAAFEAVAAKMKELRLEAVMAHLPLDDILQNEKRYVKRMKDTGMKSVAIPWMEEERLPGGARYAETREAMAALAKRFNAEGLSLGYHNHEFEFKKVEGKCKLDILLEDIPDILAHLDVCWCTVGGQNPAEYLKRYRGRVPVIHLKDFSAQGLTEGARLYDLMGQDASADVKKPGGFKFQPVGMGVVDFQAIFQTAAEAGVEWMSVEQDLWYEREPMETARLSLEYIRANYGK
jgi:sugar phosphate isomerase/epimerase